MSLNDNIIEILRQHPEGGEKFFDALDLKLRSDCSIGQEFVNWVCSYDFPNLTAPVTIDGVPKNTPHLPLRMEAKHIGIVVTGRFGHYLMSNFSKTLVNTFKDVIVVNGGIREGKKPEIFKDRLSSYWILLDDSYYSGSTAISIAKALREIQPSANLVQAFVVYDGSRDDSKLVKSMFKYYGRKEQEAQTISDN